MPRPTLTGSLQSAIIKLKKERVQHVAAVAEIDAVFAKFGMTPARSARRGRKPGPKPGRKAAKPRRRRKHFKQTAEAYVLGLLKGKTLSTAKINAAWKRAGRGGTVNNTLTKLVKGKKVKRQNIKGTKGSIYSAA